MTKNMIPCPNCEALFYNPPCRTKAGREYCCLECKLDHLRKKNQMICKGCGTNFYCSPGDQNAGRGKYCCRKCYLENKPTPENKSTEERLKEISDTYKNGATWAETINTCKCSNKILQRAIDLYNVPKRNPRRSKVTENTENQMIAAYINSQKSMQAINKEFGCSRGTMEYIVKRKNIPVHPWTKPPVTEETRRKISENHADVSGKNNPMYGKSPGHGRWTYVSHLGKKVRSTWEYEIALALLNLEIVHEFETNRIFSGNWSYMPDFYLPEWGMYIEVKGWINERSKKKLRKLFRERPEVSLLLISPSRYKRILENNNFLLNLIIKKAYRGVLI